MERAQVRYGSFFTIPQTRMKHSPLLLAFLFAVQQTHAAAGTQQPSCAPACIELHDQYDAPQRLAFPSSNVVVLTIADKKGSEQIDGWVTPIKARYGARVELRGLADVGGVPGWLRGKVRKRFQESRPYPVMMDWFGTNCSSFAYQTGVANLLVIGRDGTIHARFAGAATPAALAQAGTVLDRILPPPPKSAPGALRP